MLIHAVHILLYFMEDVVGSEASMHAKSCGHVGIRSVFAGYLVQTMQCVFYKDVYDQPSILIYAIYVQDLTGITRRTSLDQTLCTAPSVLDSVH